MANNYGLKTRDISKAGKFALNRGVSEKAIGFESAKNISTRWQQFAAYAKAQGVKKLEHIGSEVAHQYGRALAERVNAGELAPSTAQNLMSAVNTTMNLASRGAWAPVYAVRDCAIGRRSNVRETLPQLARETIQQAAAKLRSADNERGAVVLELARDLGLRAREASLLDARRAVEQAQASNWVTITDGTKGGRPRALPINESQLATLKHAAHVQANARAVMPPDQNYVQWKNGGLRNARGALQNHGVQRVHDLRAAFALDRYQAFRTNGLSDRDARLNVSAELGHGRIDILSSYIGSYGR